ncbi:MAG: InlB B-repeat-containing protein, partial [Clostridiales Family XIII bacterium]|nr:InlB B-repeat-containing protein [Clostridiales Family XIII bacterium]
MGAISAADIVSVGVGVSPTSFQPFDDLSNGTTPSRLRIDISFSTAASYTSDGIIKLPLNYVPGEPGNNPGFYTDGVTGHTTGGLDPFFELDTTALAAAVASSQSIDSYAIDDNGTPADPSDDAVLFYLNDTTQNPSMASLASSLTLWFDFNGNYKRLVPTGTVMWNVQPLAYVGADLSKTAGSMQVTNQNGHNFSTMNQKTTPVGSEYISGQIQGYFRILNNYYYEQDLAPNFINSYGFEGNIIFFDVPAGWSVNQTGLIGLTGHFNCTAPSGSGRTDGAPIKIKANGDEWISGTDAPDTYAYDRYYRVLSTVMPTQSSHPDWTWWNQGGQVYNAGTEWNINAAPPTSNPPAVGSTISVRTGSQTQRVNAASVYNNIGSLNYNVVTRKDWAVLDTAFHGTTGSNPALPISPRSSTGVAAPGHAYAGTYRVGMYGLTNTGSFDLQGVAYEFSQANDDTLSPKVNFNYISFNALCDTPALGTSVGVWTKYRLQLYVKTVGGAETEKVNTVFTPASGASSYDFNLSANNLTSGSGLPTGQYISRIVVTPLGIDGSSVGHLSSMNAFNIYYKWQGWESATYPDGTTLPARSTAPLAYKYSYYQTDVSGSDYSGNGNYNTVNKDGGTYTIIYSDAVNAYARMISSDSSTATSGGMVHYQIQGLNDQQRTARSWVEPRIAIRVPKFMTISDTDINNLQLITTSGGGQTAGVPHNVAASLTHTDDNYNYYAFSVPGYTAPRGNAGVYLFYIPIEFQIDAAAQAGTYAMNRVLASSVDGVNFVQATDFDSLNNLPNGEDKGNYGFEANENYRNYGTNTALTIPTVITISNSTAVSSGATGGQWVASQVVPAQHSETVKMQLTMANSGNSEVGSLRLYDIIPKNNDALGSSGTFTFAGVTPAGSGTVYYTTAPFASLPRYGDHGGPAPDLQTFSTSSLNWGGVTWTATQPALSAVTAIFVVFDGSVKLLPTASIPIEMQFSIPDAAAGSQTVYNEFRYSCIQTGDSTSRNWDSPMAGFSTESIMIDYRANKPDSAPASPDVIVMPVNRSGVWHTSDVELNAGGSTGNYNDYESLTVSSTQPTLVGYTFDSWNTQADGNGTTVSPGKRKFSAAGEILTLYAKWTRSIIPVAYDVNDFDSDGVNKSFPVSPAFTAAAGSDTAAYNGLVGSTATVAAGVAPGTPGRPGFTFLGWYEAKALADVATSAGGWDFSTGKVIGPLDSTAKTFYAGWSADTIAVKYYYNTADTSTEYTNQTPGGGNATKLSSGTFGGVLTAAPDPNPVHAGWTFGGWYTAGQGGGLVSGGKAWTFGEVSTGTPITAANDVNTTAKTLDLYAKWTQKNYKVIYDLDGGKYDNQTPWPDNTPVHWDDANLLPDGAAYDTAKVTREGYTFQGWKVSAGGPAADATATSKYSDLATNDATMQITIKAQWKEKDLTVSYRYNGADTTTAYTNQNAGNATATMLGSGVYDGTLATAPAPEPTRAGYTFGGWFPNGTGNGAVSGVQWAFGGTGTALTTAAGVANATGTPSLTLYAKWTLEAPYTIEYAGLVGVTAQPSPKPTSYTVETVSGSRAVGNPTKAGYTFTGWTVNYDDTAFADISALNTSYSIPVISDLAGGGTATTTGKITLTANWSAPISYDVEYAGLAGVTAQPSPKPASYTVETASGLRAVGNPAKAGYTFTGWTVNYDDAAFADISTPNTNYSIPTTSNLTASGTATTTGKITLTANWSAPISYDVEYAGLAGVTAQPSPKPTSYTVETVSGLRAVGNPTKAGYTFTGWTVNYDDAAFADISAPNTSYAVPAASTLVAGGTATTTGKITLTANWSAPIDYDITYAGLTGVTAEPSPKPATYNVTETPASVGNPTKAGYTFTGWTVNYDDSAFADISTLNTNYSIPAISDLAGGGTATTTGDITLTANWSAPIDYDINYEGLAGVTAEPSPKPVTYNVTETPVSVGNPAKAGYTFTGWTVDYDDAAFADISAPNTSYAVPATSTLVAGGTATTTGDITLTANWSAPNEYGITYNLDSGTNGAGNPAKYTIEDTPVTIADATRIGYTFEGWTSTELGLVNNTKNVVIPANTTGAITLTAHWSAPITYDITYKLNGGTNDSSNPDDYDVTQLPISIKNPTREGYTFDGWTATGGLTIGTETKSAKIPKDTTGNITFTAHWTIKTYTVTYIGNGHTSGAAPAATTHNHGSNATVKTQETLARDSHSFSGWNTAADGSGSAYVAGSAISNIAGNQTLYAQWTYNAPPTDPPDDPDDPDDPPRRPEDPDDDPDDPPVVPPAPPVDPPADPTPPAQTEVVTPEPEAPEAATSTNINVSG